MNNSYLKIWKLLGVIEPGKEGNVTNNGDLKTLCPFHEDTQESLVLDKNPEGKNKTAFASGRCWACQSVIDNVSPSRMWMKEFAHQDYKNDALWKTANKLLDKINDTVGDYAENSADLLSTRTRSYDYQLIKRLVLDIFDEDVLEEQNPDWEEILDSMIQSKDISATKQNPHVSRWDLTFSVGYGEDFKIGEVAYHPTDPNSKISTSKGTKNGHFMPFYNTMDTEFAGNINKSYKPNLLASTSKKIIIVEGQKDMLALRLLGVPAITITGGAASTAFAPEIFSNKDVYIIYDNDKAGLQGAEALGTQIAEFASTVFVSQTFYKDLAEKEDAYDFLFKYNKPIGEFFNRMKDESNFKKLDIEQLEKIRLKAKADAEKARLNRKAIVAKSFQETFSLPMHSLVKVDAKVDSFDVKVSHNIYNKPLYKINNVAPNDKKMEIDQIWKRIIKTIEKATEHTGSSNLKVEVMSDRQIVVSAELDERHMDIIERIMVETSKKTDDAYKEAFKIFDYTVSLIAKESKGLITTSLDFDRTDATDYTEMWISQDMSFQELSESGGANQQVYSVFMPSDKIERSTKQGDKITIIAGKLKRHKDNRPFLLGYDIEYRDPIENYELNDTTIASLDKFKYKGEETAEALDAHMDIMYKAMLLEGPEAQKYTKEIWQTMELTWNSVRLLNTEDVQGNKHLSRGVLDTLIVGDSGTGKSKTSDRFMAVYGTGVKQEFSKATPKGLIGGSDVGNKNKINPGLLPQNDKALVVLEELSGMNGADKRQELFQELLEIRSAGEVLLSRVSDKVKVTANVRLLMVSNPIDSSGEAGSLSAYKATSYWSAVEMLVPAIPSLNRFTFFHFPRAEEMTKVPDYNGILEEFGGQSPFTIEDWRNKIQWVWSRKAEHVVISNEVGKYIQERVDEALVPVLNIKNREVGLFSRGRTAVHITNLTAAFAAATVSTIDFENVLVKKFHVDAAIKWLLKMYNEETGIPRYVRTTNKGLSASGDDMDIILGRENIDATNTIYNQVLNFGAIVPDNIKSLLYDMYTDLYGFATDGGDGTVIHWNNVKTYFQSIEMAATGIGQVFDGRGDQTMGAWKLAMKKLGVIKENPRNDRQFKLQPKFLDIYVKLQMHLHGDEEE